MFRTCSMMCALLLLALSLESKCVVAVAAEPEFAAVRDSIVAACLAKEPPEDGPMAGKLAEFIADRLNERGLTLSPDEETQLGTTLAKRCPLFDSVCRYPEESEARPIALEIAKTELEEALELWIAMRGRDPVQMQKTSKQTELLVKDINEFWLANLPASVDNPAGLLKPALASYRQQRQAMIDDGTSAQFKTPLTDAGIVQWKQRFNDRLAKSWETLEGKLETDNPSTRDRQIAEWLMKSATDAVIAEHLTRVDLKLATPFQPTDLLKELQNRKTMLLATIAPFEKAQSQREIVSMQQRVKDQLRRKAQEIEDRKAALALDDANQQLRMQARAAAEEKQRETVAADRRTRPELPVETSMADSRFWLIVGNVVGVSLLAFYFFTHKRAGRGKSESLPLLLIVASGLGCGESIAGETASVSPRLFVEARLGLLQNENRARPAFQRQMVVVLDHFRMRLEREIEPSTSSLAQAEELVTLSSEVDLAVAYLSQDGIQLSEGELQALTLPVIAEPLRRLATELQMGQEQSSEQAIAAAAGFAVCEWTNPMTMPIQQADKLREKLVAFKAILPATFERYAAKRQEFILERDRITSKDARSRFEESFLQSAAWHGAVALRRSLVPSPSEETRRLTRWLQSERHAATPQIRQSQPIALSPSSVAKEHLDSLLFTLIWPQFQD